VREPRSFVAANSGKITVLGKVILPVQVFDKITTLEFFVIKDLSPNVILGVDAMQKMNINFDFGKGIVEFFDKTRAMNLIKSHDHVGMVRVAKSLVLNPNTEQQVPVFCLNSYRGYRKILPISTPQWNLEFVNKFISNNSRLSSITIRNHSNKPVFLRYFGPLAHAVKARAATSRPGSDGVPTPSSMTSVSHVGTSGADLMVEARYNVGFRQESSRMPDTQIVSQPYPATPMSQGPMNTSSTTPVSMYQDNVTSPDSRIPIREYCDASSNTEATSMSHEPAESSSTASEPLHHDTSAVYDMLPSVQKYSNVGTNTEDTFMSPFTGSTCISNSTGDSAPSRHQIDTYSPVLIDHPIAALNEFPTCNPTCNNGDILIASLVETSNVSTDKTTSSSHPKTVSPLEIPPELRTCNNLGLTISNSELSREDIKRFTDLQTEYSDVYAITKF